MTCEPRLKLHYENTNIIINISLNIITFLFTDTHTLNTHLFIHRKHIYYQPLTCLKRRSETWRWMEITFQEDGVRSELCQHIIYNSMKQYNQVWITTVNKSRLQLRAAQTSSISIQGEERVNQKKKKKQWPQPAAKLVQISFFS